MFAVDVFVVAERFDEFAVSFVARAAVVAHEFANRRRWFDGIAHHGG